MGIATNAWPTRETDPQRIALLDAADRLFAGTPRRSTGKLSVVQLAIEADLKYWILVQKHTDLRDHFQLLTAKIRRTPNGPTADNQTATRYRELRQHCTSLEALLQSYAMVINELARENQALRQQHTPTTVTPLQRRTSR